MLPEYAALMDSAVAYGKGAAGKGMGEQERLDLVMDRLAVNCAYARCLSCCLLLKHPLAARVYFCGGASVGQAKPAAALTNCLPLLTITILSHDHTSLPTYLPTYLYLFSWC